MIRNAETDLLNWFKKKSSRKPLVLRGARQVGKSTLVRQFCLNNKIDIIELNLEKLKLKSIINKFDIPSLLEEIEFITKKSFSSKNILLFIDEIQEQPRAFEILRYFYEETPQIPVIAAGSLLDLMLNDEQVSVPVGRIEYYKLGPMTFTEYLLAVGENRLCDLIQNQKSVPEIAHHLLIEHLQKYMFIGGMPESIKTYIETKSLLEVRKIQNDLINSYQEDFIKYSKKNNIVRVSKVFNYIPFNLGKKIKFASIDSEEKARDLKYAIELLKFSRIAIAAVHTNCSGLPISAQSDEKIFKLYFLDIGLVGAMTDLQWTDLISKDSHLLKGPLAEQFVAQHLYQLHHHNITDPLYYWLRDKDSNKAEIDFVIQEKSKIIPIEVKADKNGKLKSLIQFNIEKKPQIAFKICTDQLKKEGNLITLPLYLIENILNFID